MLVSNLGEDNLLRMFRQKIRTDKSVIVGSGDDCAVLKLDKNNYQLFTCDMLVEEVDFLSSARPYLVGRKAIGVCVSDIASCGGLPRHCLISLGMPKTTPLKKVGTLFKGMLDAAKEFRVNIAGGDLSASPRLVIDVSMLGVVEKQRLALRSNARIGDIIFVSGPLGGSLSGKHLNFCPRIKEARFLVKNFKVGGMIDISDGLAKDLGHILEESKLGAVIYEELIPQSSYSKGLKDALYSGEDFELLFTLSCRQARRLSMLDKFGFRAIGEIIPPKYGLNLVNKAGRQMAIPKRGFTHFK